MSAVCPVRSAPCTLMMSPTDAIVCPMGPRLLACQTADHGSEGIEIALTHREIADAVFLAAFFDDVADLVDGADVRVRVHLHVFGRDPEHLGEIGVDGVGVGSNDGEIRADLEFEIEVIDVMSQQTFERNLKILQQAMQSQLGQGGAPAPAPAQ